MTLTYTSALPCDAEAVFSLSKALIDAYEHLSLIDYDKVIAWVRRSISEHIGQYTRILADGQLAGYYYFHPADDVMELDDLFILPGFRGQGIGSAAIGKCCEESPLPVRLYVFQRNRGALRLYERMGFRIVREIHDSRYVMQRTP